MSGNINKNDLFRTKISHETGVLNVMGQIPVYMFQPLDFNK